MLSVEGTAGNVVLKALQNVIENVRRNHYSQGDCPDLSVCVREVESCSCTAMEPGQATLPFVLAYIYFKYKGMITSVRCFI